MIKRSLCTTLVALCGGLGTLPALEGNRLIGVGPLQLGQVGAGVAEAQDSTWIGLNPAGLHGLGSRLDLSLYWLRAEDHIEPAGVLGNPTVDRMEDEATALIPNITLTHPWGPGTAGFGIYGVGGLDLTWPEPRSSVPLLGGGDWDREVNARFVRAGVAYSYPIDERWQLGLALDLDYQSFESDALTRSGSQTEGGGDTDEALGGGFIIGLQRSFESVQLGLAYHSRHWMQRLDEYRDLLDGPLDQPQMLQLGLSWAAHERVTVLLDYRYLGWSAVHAIGDQDEGFGWRDQHIVKLAASGMLSETVRLRGGISYGRSPIEEEEAFINGLTPLIAELHAALGLDWQITGQAQLQLAYVHAFGNELTDDGSGLGGAGEGTVIGLDRIDSLALGLGWRF